MSSKLVCVQDLFPVLKEKSPSAITVKYDMLSHATSIFFDNNCFWSGSQIFMNGITFGDYSAYEEICNLFANNNKAFNTLSKGFFSSKFSKII